MTLASRPSGHGGVCRLVSPSLFLPLRFLTGFRTRSHGSSCWLRRSISNGHTFRGILLRAAIQLRCQLTEAGLSIGAAFTPLDRRRFIQECRPGHVHFHPHSCFSSVSSILHFPAFPRSPCFSSLHPVGIHRASDLHSDTLPTTPSYTTTPLTKQQNLNQLSDRSAVTEVARQSQRDTELLRLNNKKYPSPETETSPRARCIVGVFCVHGGL
jgi:hypothetical protein